MMKYIISLVLLFALISVKVTGQNVLPKLKECATEFNVTVSPKENPRYCDTFRSFLVCVAKKVLPLELTPNRLRILHKTVFGLLASRGSQLTCRYNFKKLAEKAWSDTLALDEKDKSIFDVTKFRKCLTDFDDDYSAKGNTVICELFKSLLSCVSRKALSKKTTREEIKRTHMKISKVIPEATREMFVTCRSSLYTNPDTAMNDTLAINGRGRKKCGRSRSMRKCGTRRLRKDRF